MTQYNAAITLQQRPQMQMVILQKLHLGTRQAKTSLSTGSTKTQPLAPELVSSPPGSHTNGGDEGSRHGAGG